MDDRGQLARLLAAMTRGNRPDLPEQPFSPPGGDWMWPPEPPPSMDETSIPPGMMFPMAPPPPPSNLMGPPSGMPSPGFNAGPMPDTTLLDPRPNEFPWAGLPGAAIEPPTGIPTPEQPLDKAFPYTHPHQPSPPGGWTLPKEAEPPPMPMMPGAPPPSMRPSPLRKPLEREFLKPRQYGLGQLI